MNDERPIAKLLRRYANKRRGAAGSPLELHPATRRLLQGEIARRFRKDAPGNAQVSLAEMFKSWRWQLAWAVPLLALVVIGSWSLREQRETQQLALGPTRKLTTAESLVKEAPGEVRSNPAPATVAEIKLAEASTDKTLTPPTASVPVRGLNPPIPSLSDNSLADEDRRTKQSLAVGGTREPSATSLASVTEKKADAGRFGFDDTARADKSRLAALAPPAQGISSEPTHSNVEFANGGVRPFRAARANSTPAVSSAESDLPHQLIRGIETGSVARPSSQALPLPAAPSTFPNLAGTDNRESDQNRIYSQSFVTRPSATPKQKVAKDFSGAVPSLVLTNFRVEQTGRQLRVVDGDGSTYFGVTDPQPVALVGGGGKQDQAAQSSGTGREFNLLPGAAASSSPPQGEPYFYRVAGTNRTLHQAVVFSWNFMDMTNLEHRAQSGSRKNELDRAGQRPPSLYPARLQDFFINGRARFESGQEIEVNAVPVTP